MDPDPGKMSDPITINSKYMYGRNAPGLYRDPSGRDFWNDVLKIGVIIGAAVTGAWVAGLAAGALGFAAGSAGAIITGVLAGAAGGGAFGALAYPVLGLGTSREGFFVGAGAGALGGLAKGAGWLGDFGVSNYKGGKLVRGIEDGVNSFIKGLASPGSSNPTFALAKGTEFTAFLGTIEPYVVGIVGGAYANSLVYNCSVGNCDIPRVPIFNQEFK